MKNVKQNSQTTAQQDQNFLDALKKISGQENPKSIDIGGPRRDIGPH